MKWYAKEIGVMKTRHSKSVATQALVIDEATGRNVAVSYDPKDARLIAAAPDLLAALEWAGRELMEAWDEDMPEPIRAAIAKARGE